MKTNIKDLPEDKLLELLVESLAESNIFFDGVTYTQRGEVVEITTYNPVADSIQGKGQALDLVEKLKISINHSASGEYDMHVRGYGWIDDAGKNLQWAIVLTAVASVCGEEVEL